MCLRHFFVSRSSSPSLFYPLSLRHVCLWSLHWLTLSCLKVDHLNERELLMFANKPFLRFPLPSHLWVLLVLYPENEGDCTGKWWTFIWNVISSLLFMVSLCTLSHWHQPLLKLYFDPNPHTHLPTQNADWLLLVFVVSTSLGSMRMQIRLHIPWPLVC